MKQKLFLILITCLYVLIGCSQQPSETVLRYEENNEIIGPEKDKLIGDISNTIFDSIDRNNTKAQELMVGPIGRTGEDVVPPEGRYTISAVPSPEGLPQSGRVLIYDEEDKLLIHELLDYGFGVGSVTVDLNGSHTVHIDGLDNALINPTPTQLSNELTTGIWEVGKDIDAGNYHVMATSAFDLGDLHIFEEGQPPTVYEILNTSPDSMISVELKDGQRLRITGVSTLQFKPI